MTYSETITRTDLTNILNEVLPPDGVDYIVEEGTHDIWTYRKWNSGISECWGTYTKTVSIASNGYVNMVAGNFPSGLFVSKPNVAGSGGGVGNPQVFLMYANPYQASSQWAGVDSYLRNMRGSTHSGEAWVAFHVIGTWK